MVRISVWNILLVLCTILAACSSHSDSDSSVSSSSSEQQTASIHLYNDWEITQATPLLNADGTLSAWGWSRHARMTYDRSLVKENVSGRLKEWEFYCVMSPDCYMEITLADISWAELTMVSVVDYLTGKSSFNLRFGLQSDYFTLPSDPCGSTVFDNAGAHVAYSYDEPVRTLEFDFPWTVLPAIKGTINIQHRPSDERLATAMPFDFAGSFFYTNKIVGMPATGEITVNNTTYTFPAGASYAVLDWGRGVWPEEFAWTWAAAFGTVDGVPIGFNIGYGEEDSSRTSASGVFYNGVLHKMGKITWSFDANDAMQPWRFTSADGRFDVTLSPFYDQSNTIDLGVYATDITKAHGTMNGRVVLDNGKTIEIKDILGFAEYCIQRW